MSDKHVLAIDLGTYNSAAVVLHPTGEIKVISENPEHRIWKKSGESIKPFPSVVVYHPSGKVRAVGREAKDLAETEPDWAVWGVKRLLGKTYKEAVEHNETGRMLIPVEPDETNGRCMFIFEEEDVRPEDVLAELLKHIRHTAESQTKTDLPDVIISVPAYFDAIAVGATIDAAKKAGFEGIHTIPEPVAAAVAMDIDVTPRPLNFLVFDIGAGTLDVSAAEVWRSKPGFAGLSCDCKKNTGDTHLGGMDMDDRLVRLLTERMELMNLNEEDRHALRRAAEAAKVRLSLKQEAEVRLRIGGTERTYVLNRFEFEEALRSDPMDLVEGCRNQVQAALKGAGWKDEDVDYLLLVGGPTAVPCLMQMLSSLFYRNSKVMGQIRDFEEGLRSVSDSEEHKSSLDRMLAVAIGAANSTGVAMKKIHPYGYGFVNIRLEPEKDPGWYKEIRESRIVLPRDTGIPSDPVVVIPDNPFYRKDKVFCLELIQHVPESEQEVHGFEKHPYRFLGEMHLPFRRLPFMVQVLMRLNENGELETRVKNLYGPESITFIGAGSLLRVPIELPVMERKYFPPERISDGIKYVFVAAHSEEMKQWGEGFQRFLSAKTRNISRVDPFITDKLDDMQRALNAWDKDLETGVNMVFTIGAELLYRAQELKIITEGEYHNYDDNRVKIREKCFKPVSDDQ